MAAFPVEVLLGVYLGILTGIIPAAVAWGLGFIFKYFTGVSIPAFAVVVLALAIAGANGGLLALADPTVTEAPNQITLTTAIVVVLMISLYAHAKGDSSGESMPRHLSLGQLRHRTLSTDVVELVGGLGHVRVTVAGEVEDIEGYPTLSDDLRARIRDGEWTFPADLPISELETRLVDALRTEYDIADASVRINERGHASIAAAPPIGGVSKRIQSGERAVSIRAIVPSGLARGDEVTVHLETDVIKGTVVSARSDVPEESARIDRSDPGVTTDGGVESTGSDAKPSPRSPTTTGGDGRLTLAVDQERAADLLGVDRAHVVVRARGTRREFELVSLLRKAGRRIGKLTMGTDGSLDGRSIGDAAIRDNYDVSILAVRRSDGWDLTPGGSTVLGGGDELFVVGSRDAIGRFREAVS